MALLTIWYRTVRVPVCNNLLKFRFEFERYTLATYAPPWLRTHASCHILLDVVGPLLVMSLFSKIIESSQLKKWLVGADSPLEFSRQTVRLNGDITTRSQAAHTKDRLDVANNVVLGLKFWALKRDRESKIFRARKRARKEKNEEELELMALGCHLLEPSSLSSAGLNAMFETNMAFHFFEKVGQNLSCPRVDRDGVVQPLRFEVTINHYDDAMCYKYFAMTRAELHRLFEAWGVRSVFKTRSRYSWSGESASGVSTPMKAVSISMTAACSRRKRTMSV